MIEQGKISSIQMAILMFPTILATSILSVPSITMTYAGHDMWLSPIWASLMGVATVCISVGLHKLYPRSTMMTASTQILGFIPGKLFGLLYLYFLPHITGVVIRQYGEFVSSTALPQTPILVIMATLTVVSAVNVRLGIEVVGRSSQIFVAFIALLILFVFVLLTGEFHPEELLPLGEKGILPSLKGAVAPSAWYAEYILLAFLTPFIKDSSNILNRGLWSVLLVTVTMLASNLACLFLMGDLTESFNYPLFIAARYITIADFMQHLEAMIIAIWIAGIFVKISVFLYVFSVAVAEWFQLKDYKPVVFPLTFLCMVYSFWIVNSPSDLASLINGGGNLYTLFFMFLLPALLLCFGMVKHKLAKAKKGATSS